MNNSDSQIRLDDVAIAYLCGGDTISRFGWWVVVACCAAYLSASFLMLT